jgi:DNA polymerase III sliding clamp (beta) subunit (PCNA family)
LAGILPDAKAVVPDGIVMEFKAPRASLLSALNDTAPCVPANAPQKVLSNFHVRADENLRVTATDTTLTAIRYSMASVSQKGRAVFPTARFHTIVREAGDDLHVRVVSKAGKMMAGIRSGSTVWKIPLMDPESFPDFSATEEVGLVEVEREGFLAALQKVRRAASEDSMQPYLNLVDISKGRMRASDSIRFQQVKYDFPFDCQIPNRAAHALVQRLQGRAVETFGVGATDKALLFKIGDTLLIAQKIMAKFPDVDDVLLKPTLANDQELRVSRKDLLRAIVRVRVTADEATSAVVLSLNHGSVSVEAKDRRGGSTVEEVAADWNYSPRHVSYNHKHLTDMLASTDSTTCVFRLGKELKTRPTPLLMEDEAAGFIAVLSQIRLDW